MKADASKKEVHVVLTLHTIATAIAALEMLETRFHDDTNARQQVSDAMAELHAVVGAL